MSSEVSGGLVFTRTSSDLLMVRLVHVRLKYQAGGLHLMKKCGRK